MKTKWMFLFMIGMVLFGFLGCQKSDEENTQARIPVNIVKVKTGAVTQTLSYHGDIVADQEIKVFSKIPDRIMAFHIDEGGYIPKGGLIAEISATPIEQAVKQAEAGLTAASAQKNNMQAEYDRAMRLKQEDAMSEQQFDAVTAQYEGAMAQYEQALAALTSAKSQYNDTQISAPISGIIGKRYYETGDMTNPAVPVVTVVQMNQVKIVFNVPEKDLGLLSEGQSAKISVLSFPDMTFQGKVIKISPVLDPMTRMADVEVLINNPKHLLKPGMYAEVEITTGVLENVLVVPRYAVIETSSLKKIDGQDKVIRNYFVFTVQDSTARQNQLDVIYVNHQYMAVDTGISVGDQLVVSGQNNLREGLPVLIVEEEE